MNRTIEIIDQIYKNHQFVTSSHNESYSAFSHFISVSSNIDYIRKLKKTSAKLSLFYKMLPYYLPPRAPKFKEENILYRNVAEVDFEELGLTDRHYRSRLNKELKSFNLAFHLSDNKYFINPFYINNYNKQQFNDMLVLFHSISVNKENELVLSMSLKNLKML